ncbi:hypothetical protein PVAND_007597 [Polypedilum vanderplanki]|uniref:Uncharacterized protein n=1 Tax=Polypedilum vanderplanki TaxID=319348 RepID=A0A9J6C7P3_POLVA|nr:hypothetical protein PVAND_007597 [Polypedilum vanderplanki]
MYTFSLLLLLVITKAVAKRTYTIPSPHGSFSYKLFKCEYPESSLRDLFYSNYSCYAKSYSRTLSTINGHLYFKKPINEAYISAVLYYKYGTIYREIIKLNKFNICDIFKLANDNILVKQILTIAEASAPDIVHNCPFTFVAAYNVSFPSHLLFSVFSQGDYKVIVRFFIDAEGPEISNVTVIGTAISPIKESFG